MSARLSAVVATLLVALSTSLGSAPTAGALNLPDDSTANATTATTDATLPQPSSSPEAIEPTSPTSGPTPGSAPDSALPTDPIEPSPEPTPVADDQSAGAEDTPVTSPTDRDTATTEPSAPAVATIIDPFSVGETRLAGPTRYQTAIAASSRFAPGVPAVFIATGLNFPDGLSAAAASARIGAPLLLTPPGGLSGDVLAEIKRLRPSQIFISGDTGVVGADIQQALATVAPVTRLGGIDRFATSLSISRAIFDHADFAVIATGMDFPDALSASGVAGLRSAPVLLVNGTQPRLQEAALAELRRLGVSSVLIAGGTSVVSTGIAQQLTSGGFTVDRQSGDDRYATAARINEAYFPMGSAAQAFVATGENFPDALAGAALAGNLKAPLFITRPSCMPPSIGSVYANFAATGRVALGDTAVVSGTSLGGSICAGDSIRPLVPGPPTSAAMFVSPHPDDEFEMWSQIEFRPDVYTIFVVLTRGEQSDPCNVNRLSSLLQANLGEIPPSPLPKGLWTPQCEQARINSTLNFLAKMSLTDASIPGRLTEVETQTLAPNDAICRKDGGDPICDRSAREVTVRHDAMGRGALVQFNLGDGDLTVPEVEAALRTLLDSREAWGLAPGLPMTGIFGAFSNTVPGRCIVYPHPDHRALHDALWTIDFGAGPQRAATCDTDSQADFAGTVTDASGAAAFHMGPGGIRMGAHGQYYGWLNPSYWPLSTNGSQADLFQKHQSFWTRFG